MIENPFLDRPCPVCNSPYFIHLRDVGTARTHRSIPLNFCMSCHSLSCPGDYAETDSQWASDVGYHLKYADEKRQPFRRLCSEMFSLFTHRPSLADIGCAVGVLVEAADACGFVGHGYDVNRHAIAKGQEIHPKIADRLYPVLFGSDSKSYDMVTIVDVLEHIDQPRPMLQTIADGVKLEGYLYVIVPRLDENLWHLLRETVAEQMTARQPSTFCDTDVHVTHFSTQGLRKCGEDAGFRMVRDYTQEYPLNGMLFKKV